MNVLRCQQKWLCYSEIVGLTFYILLEFLLYQYLIMQYDRNQATGVKNMTKITIRGWIWF
jgi:hypothetical protein